MSESKPERFNAEFTCPRCFHVGNAEIIATCRHGAYAEVVTALQDMSDALERWKKFNTAEDLLRLGETAGPARAALEKAAGRMTE